MDGERREARCHAQYNYWSLSAPTHVHSVYYMWRLLEPEAVWPVGEIVCARGEEDAKTGARTNSIWENHFYPRSLWKYCVYSKNIKVYLKHYHGYCARQTKWTISTSNIFVNWCFQNTLIGTHVHFSFLSWMYKHNN